MIAGEKICWTWFCSLRQWSSNQSAWNLRICQETITRFIYQKAKHLERVRNHIEHWNIRSLLRLLTSTMERMRRKRAGWAFYWWNYCSRSFFSSWWIWIFLVSGVGYLQKQTWSTFPIKRVQKKRKWKNPQQKKHLKWMTLHPRLKITHKDKSNLQIKFILFLQFCPLKLFFLTKFQHLQIMFYASFKQSVCNNITPTLEIVKSSS